MTPAGSSAHNYGIAVDLRILDAEGNILAGTNPATGSNLYERLVPFMQAEGFAWYGPGDNGHYNYHPNWHGIEGLVVGGEFLRAQRDKAIVEEIARNWALGGPWGFTSMPVDWLANMWNKAGAPCLTERL